LETLLLAKRIRVATVAASATPRAVNLPDFAKISTLTIRFHALMTMSMSFCVIFWHMDTGFFARHMTLCGNGTAELNLWSDHENILVSRAEINQGRRKHTGLATIRPTLRVDGAFNALYRFCVEDRMSKRLEGFLDEG
jgi:hypothetical protein